MGASQIVNDSRLRGTKCARSTSVDWSRRAAQHRGVTEDCRKSNDAVERTAAEQVAAEVENGASAEV